VNRTVDPIFTNTSNDDFVFYTTTSNQSIHFGTLTGNVAPSVLQLGPCNMSVNGDISLTRQVAMNGVLVRPRETAGVNQNITATVTSIPAISSLTSNLNFTLTVPQSNFRFLNNSSTEVFNINQGGQLMALTTDTSNAPSYTWSGDSNTGMYHASNKTIGFSCGGSNIMTLNDLNGLVITNGIRTPSIQYATDQTNTSLISTSNVSIITPSTNGTTAQWAVSVEGTSGITTCAACAVDPSGNTYIAGSYTATTTTIYNASNTASSLTRRAPSAQNAAYLVKYNSNGTAVWVTTVDGPSFDNGYGCAADSNGNVYLCGLYTSSNCTVYNANNTSSGFTFRTSSGGYAAYMVKYNSDGIAQWGVSVDSSSDERGLSCVVDSDGNVYMSGFLNATATIYNANNTSSGLTLSWTGNNAAFLVKFNSSGQAQWGVRVDSTALEQALSCAVDSTGNAYMSGYYQASPTIFNANNTSSGLTLRSSSGGTNAAFVVKYNSTGQAQWAVSVDGAGDDQGLSCAVDGIGNVYLAGYYTTSSATIYNAGNSASALTMPATSGTGAAFVVKYNSNGQAQWAASVDGAGDDRGQSCAVDTLGNVYLAGYYTTSAVTVYNAGNSTSALTMPATNGTGAAFLIKYDVSGLAQWAVSADSVGNDQGFSCAVDLSGNVYLAGNYAGGGAITVYNENNIASGLTIRAAGGTTAAFMIKYNDPTYYLVSSSLTTSSNGLSKIIINSSSNSARISNINATQTSMSTITLSSKQVKQLVWYYPDWYVTADDLIPTNTSQIQANLYDTLVIPSYTWSGDSNTGMYHASNDSIGFTCGGSNVVTACNTGLIVAGSVTSTGVNASGQVNANPSATASAPAFSWSNDTDTGIYRAGANTIGFSCGGTDVMTMSTTNTTLTGYFIGSHRRCVLEDRRAARSNNDQATAQTWNVRVLNTTLLDNIGITLSTNTITLPAGTYYIKASAPAVGCGTHQTRLQNTTSGTTLLLGTSEYCVGQDNTSIRSWLEGEITVAATQSLQIQHYVEVLRTAGGTLGFVNGLGPAGVSTVYTRIVIDKLA
jgi:hypothetical protein